ncbi:hypothetical protein LAZ67_10002466 [Cordylochernes scorpioides]|uniref:Uncharacterized protein n=1 Tax=Cordylochernes scorpioides TaxID=51811 RepID=A0ABY6KYF6_9ARAC|nr:hypothetical protein LAZ67_10002466 [Cordylochernes scorpioides]
MITYHRNISRNYISQQQLSDILIPRISNIQRLNYFRHIMRANGLKKKGDVRKIEGKRGRLAMSWLEGVKKTTGRSLNELRVMITNR